ncbi:hydroxymethylglutaryl-CoA reductase, degradative [Legionella waltersii]|uniref:3-hydroxy-3-methylglutaryl coenzyme A reductase n=1 Tax=Legionella waltersii TaxID=66969 RepID=A0A0W1A0N6_9GAMM|nr:hydroxymethylglutaryl-CoA reductase, degradative [Legionella waltersii]KTD74627.1 hydroxymethylglutaryl CoA reductase [Legionella waltersii]SNV08878.1 hydroxymethylglutaryl CoA reductase [Legionella waltersii]
MSKFKSKVRVLEGFSKLTQEKKLECLINMGVLDQESALKLLGGGTTNEELLSALIENPIGWFGIPLGVAVNFCIDGKGFVIPMVTEEHSVIAGINKAAKQVTLNGNLSTTILGKYAIGQIQIACLNDPLDFDKKINDKKAFFLHEVNQAVLNSLFKRGGGAADITVRKLERPDKKIMGILHVLIDPIDSMGANRINQACEFLRELIESHTGEEVSLCILSNLADQKLTAANAVIYNIDPVLGKRIEEASLFAQLDPYRAATNNKGVMNGIDAVLIATGNDWRAVEAGVHAYAARNGQYSSITKWEMNNGHLHGEILIPLQLGVVGGVTRIHPIATICLKILGVSHADELSRIVAAVGLIQNFAALNALVSEGIVHSHMKLHIKNIVLSVAAQNEEIPILTQMLLSELEKTHSVNETIALEMLKKIRQNMQRV